MAIGEIDKVIDTPLAEETEPKFEYPGIPTTCDGAESVVWVETRVCQGTGAYPITSSTTMGSGFNNAVMNGIPNLWGQRARLHGAGERTLFRDVLRGVRPLAGGRVTNFTSGPGPGADEGGAVHDLRQAIAGSVQHWIPRALTSHSLNVHAGHDDVMSGCRLCGWGALFARNAQEAGDLCLISEPRGRGVDRPRSSNIQDGFLTTHTVESRSGCRNRNS